MRRETLAAFAALACIGWGALAPAVWAQPVPEPPPLKPAYRVLNVTPESSPEEIEKSFREKAAEEGLSNESKAELVSSYYVLSRPELKQAYDSGEAISPEIEIAPDDRAAFARLLRDLDPKESSRVLRTGKAGVRAVLDMGTFYLASGIQQYWDCFRARDPVPCRKWSESVIKPGAQHLSFLLFVGSQKLASHLTLKAAAGTSYAPFLANMMGLTAGSLLSQSISEVTTNPHFAEAWEAQKLKDPKERSRKRSEALRKLRDETFGKKDWYLQQAGGIPTLLAASVASEISWNVGSAIRKKIYDRYKNPRVACFMDRFVASSLGSKVVTHSSAVGQLLSFFAWDGVLSSPISRGIERLTLDRSLRKSRSSLFDATQGKWDSIAADPSALEAFSSQLDRNSKLWDQYREKQLDSEHRIEAMHKPEIVELDQASQKPGAFYAWISDGMREKSGYLKDLRSGYYDAETPLKQIQADALPYLRGFFCGPDPAHAFRDAVSVHGIPIPGMQDVKVSAYRVAEPRNPDLCKSSEPSLEALKAELAPGKFTDELRTANSQFEAANYPEREKKIRAYESLLSKEMIGALEGSGGNHAAGRDQLPRGVLPSFEAQLADLNELKAQAKGVKAIEQRLELQIAAVEREREAAQQLLDYLKTPEDRREAPPISIQDLLAAATTQDKMTDDQKVAQYFKGFIIR